MSYVIYQICIHIQLHIQFHIHIPRCIWRCTGRGISGMEWLMLFIMPSRARYFLPFGFDQEAWSHLFTSKTSLEDYLNSSWEPPWHSKCTHHLMVGPLQTFYMLWDAMWIRALPQVFTAEDVKIKLPVGVDPADAQALRPCRFEYGKRCPCANFKVPIVAHQTGRWEKRAPDCWWICQTVAGRSNRLAQ